MAWWQRSIASDKNVIATVHCSLYEDSQLVPSTPLSTQQPPSSVSSAEAEAVTAQTSNMQKASDCAIAALEKKFRAKVSKARDALAIAEQAAKSAQQRFYVGASTASGGELAETAGDTAKLDAMDKNFEKLSEQMAKLQAVSAQPKRVSTEESAKRKDSNLKLAKAGLWTTFDRNTAFSKAGVGMLLGPAVRLHQLKAGGELHGFKCLEANERDAFKADPNCKIEAEGNKEVCMLELL